MKDIEVAHRVDISRNNRPQAMVVRFVRRDSRVEVLKTENNSKSRLFVVTEDLSRLNNVLKRQCLPIRLTIHMCIT